MRRQQPNILWGLRPIYWNEIAISLQVGTSDGKYIHKCPRCVIVLLPVTLCTTTPADAIRIAISLQGDASDGKYYHKWPCWLIVLLPVTYSLHHNSCRLLNCYFSAGRHVRRQISWPCCVIVLLPVTYSLHHINCRHPSTYPAWICQSPDETEYNALLKPRAKPFTRLLWQVVAPKLGTKHSQQSEARDR
jgi:hypothetical protein